MYVAGNQTHRRAWPPKGDERPQKLKKGGPDRQRTNQDLSAEKKATLEIGHLGEPKLLGTVNLPTALEAGRLLSLLLVLPSLLLLLPLPLR